MALRINSENIMTDDEKISRTKQEISAILLMLHAQITQGMTVVTDLISKNHYGLSLQEVRDSYAEEATTLDNIGIKAGELLAMVDIEK